MGGGQHQHAPLFQLAPACDDSPADTCVVPAGQPVLWLGLTDCLLGGLGLTVEPGPFLLVVGVVSFSPLFLLFGFVQAVTNVKLTVNALPRGLRRGARARKRMRMATVPSKC